MIEFVFVLVGVVLLFLVDVVVVVCYDVFVQVDVDVFVCVVDIWCVVDGFVVDLYLYYGVLIGFGVFVMMFIVFDCCLQLQVSLICLYVVGIGVEVECEVVCGFQLLCLQIFVFGCIGVCLVVVDIYVVLFNESIMFVVWEYGLFGCLGDLVFFVYIVLVVMGEGDVCDVFGVLVFVVEVLVVVGIELFIFVEKEGFVFINGIDGMFGMLVFVLYDFEMFLFIVDFVVVMLVELQFGIDVVFVVDLMVFCVQMGQVEFVVNFCVFFGDFFMVVSYKGLDDGCVQDVYLLCCLFQVYGVVCDIFVYVMLIVGCEFVSVIDNLVIMFDGCIELNGNFYGVLVVVVFDFFVILVVDVVLVFECCIDCVFDLVWSYGFLFFFVDEVGVDFGFMIVQYVVVGIVFEFKCFVVFVLVDLIFLFVMQEDYVLMGWVVVCKLCCVIDGFGCVFVIEIFIGVCVFDL